MPNSQEDAFTSVKKTTVIPQAEPAKSKPDHGLEEDSKENLDRQLDSALEETCEGSDPVSVKITK